MWADEDERRCTIVPVVEDEITQPITEKAKDNDKNDSKALTKRP